MYLRVSKKWQFTVDIIFIIIGTFIMGFAFSMFLEPNNITTGGFSGLSMIINSVLNKVGITFLSSSIIYFVLNIGLFLYALKTLGKKFAIKSVIGIVAFSLAMEVFKLIPLSIRFETLISAIYGGALMGVGTGLVVRFGGSTGGSDMIASIVKSKSPQKTIGSIVMYVDICVVALTVVAFSNGFELLPYTLIALIFNKFATDFVNEGYKQVRAYYIVTTSPDAVASQIMTKLNRGCTETKSIGMHSKEPKSVLMCLISKFQSSDLKRIVRNIDESAFVYSTDVKEVVGEWTRSSEIPQPKIEKDKIKKLKSNKKTSENDLASKSKDYSLETNENANKTLDTNETNSVSTKDETKDTVVDKDETKK